MRVNDPRQYLAWRRLDANCVIECCLCPVQFVAKDGVAFEVLNRGERVMGYMCSEECYLSHLPLELCARA